MTDFRLDLELRRGSDHVTSLPLCDVRLKNDARWHWLLLVPRRTGVKDLSDLADSDYGLLTQEVRKADFILSEIAKPEKRNVAMIGNVVAQMHIHVIGRNSSDAGWPSPVWCLGPGTPREAGEQAAWVTAYREMFADRGGAEG